ncbi:hypothetical protein FJR48_11440 [Sulfurimonas lithotrophica]|uniref:SIR2-like domain-containing protein n=1 Tax=Sulfurimonas lithotrophica TaxID=2590022 RepID=A0A5P8P3N3_9BACT|nr:hypothetical protein [Sulfurimonas lithotrophica]QFR50304.1 hypothetical protein FJR48_11440 [Sulfurimonas lithotrophica]
MANDIGFLLGAGASYELGMPLVDELTVEFKKAILRVWNMPYYRLPKEIDTILSPLFNNNTLNYEDIIGRIEVEINRNRNQALHQEWHAVLSRYLEVIFVLLLERHSKNQIYINERLQFLEPIQNYCKNSPLWIFSLNHDLIIEMLTKYLDLPLKNGFKELIDINGIKFEQLSRENMEKSQFDFIYNESGINLIKLHGALDIYVHRDENNYLKIFNGSKDTNETINNINHLIKNDATVKNGVKCTNEITYYDKDNILQFLRMTIMSGKHKYSSKVSHNMDDWFFKIFKGHINYVSELYCIGISFQDKHVNTVIYDWLSFSKERKMFIVNPYIENIPNEFNHISDQIEIIKKGFLDFLNQDEKKNLLKIKFNQQMRNLSRKNLLK